MRPIERRLHLCATWACSSLGSSHSVWPMPQQLMSIVLSGIEDFVIVYLSNILGFSEMPEQHFNHLRQVLSWLKGHGFKLKLSKWQFLKAETKYLGFISDGKGIKPDLNKVEVIREMPDPKTVRQMRGFIGTIGYYRWFIPAFSRLATSLTALTKKYARFGWTEDCQRVFDCMKELLRFRAQMGCLLRTMT